ncbi:MAG TPA: PatA/PatG family cyanobactin maturation protease [Planctomycetaceae bacterium]|nr:PatA/PatG family cyanobactin maturation protease [Planctomycetaceae bacterium]
MRCTIGEIPGLAALWAETKGDPAICIGILDAPVDRANPCLISTRIEQHWLGHHLHCSTHGTEVASVIFAHHDTHVPGIAPACRGTSIPIYDCNPETSPSTDQRELAIAIHEALAAGAHIINVSAGQLVTTGAAEPELTAAVGACAAAGVLIVAAAGNDGCDCLHVPAALPCVLAVGAMRWDGTPLDGSNWGSIYRTQGILAPGVDIPVADPHGGIELRTGTSYATAIVSGVVALLLSRERKRGHPIRPLLIRKALLAGARPAEQTASDRRLLGGRLNITNALHLLDTWNNTMTHEENLDLAAECNSQPNNGCDARLALVSPSSETFAAQVQPSHRQAPSPETRQPGSGDTVEPSTCASCRGERRLVYALGRLNYDFGSEAGLDAFKQQMRHVEDPKTHEPLWPNANPRDEIQLKEFLKAMKEEQAPGSWTAALNWTLEIGGMPAYVIQPEGLSASAGYAKLTEYFFEQFPAPPAPPQPQQQQQQQPQPQVDEKPISERVAVPGVIAGQATLQNGMRVPIINPDVRGLCNWNRKKLLEEILETEKDAQKKEWLTQSLQEFLHRLYFELQNSGQTSQERVLNYAGTNLVAPKDIFLKEFQDFKHGRALDSIRVERSKHYRLGSDCWDIVLSFFHPKEPLQHARSIHRYTVDVSAVLPVTVGEPRSWQTR